MPSSIYLTEDILWGGGERAAGCYGLQKEQSLTRRYLGIYLKKGFRVSLWQHIFIET